MTLKQAYSPTQVYPVRSGFEDFPDIFNVVNYIVRSVNEETGNYAVPGV